MAWPALAYPVTTFFIVSHFVSRKSSVCNAPFIITMRVFINEASNVSRSSQCFFYLFADLDFNKHKKSQQQKNCWLKTSRSLDGVCKSNYLSQCFKTLMIEFVRCRLLSVRWDDCENCVIFYCKLLFLRSFIQQKILLRFQNTSVSLFSGQHEFGCKFFQWNLLFRTPDFTMSRCMPKTHDSFNLNFLNFFSFRFCS